MKFENLEELIKYVITEHIDVKNSDIEFKVNMLDNIPESLSESTKNTISVKLDCLFESPIIEAMIGDENILYVESFESVKNLCGAGKISILGKEIMTNLCEMDNQVHVTLPIQFSSSTKNINFKVVISNDTNNIIQLGKNNEF